MATRYSPIFTLTDIFNNKRLKNKIPLINYKEKVRDDGKISRTTRGKTVNRLVFDTAVKGARPFYKPLIAHRSGDSMEVGGTLVGDYDDAYNGVYMALKGIRPLLRLTANNADMIRDALKEAEKNKRHGGQNSELLLRVQSMAEIEAMSDKQVQGLVNDIMENIIFSDNFPKTQKKYGVYNWKYEVNRKNKVTSQYSKIGMPYDEMKTRWERKVGV